MRCPVLLEIPAALVAEARLYSCRSHDLDAVVYVLEDYPRLIRQIRDLRSRVDQLDSESLEFDQRLEALQRACQAILDI